MGVSLNFRALLRGVLSPSDVLMQSLCNVPWGLGRHTPSGNVNCASLQIPVFFKDSVSALKQKVVHRGYLRRSHRKPPDCPPDIRNQNLVLWAIALRDVRALRLVILIAWRKALIQRHSTDQVVLWGRGPHELIEPLALDENSFDKAWLKFRPFGWPPKPRWVISTECLRGEKKDIYCSETSLTLIAHLLVARSGPVLGNQGLQEYWLGPWQVCFFCKLRKRTLACQISWEQEPPSIRCDKALVRHWTG